MPWANEYLAREGCPKILQPLDATKLRATNTKALLLRPVHRANLNRDLARTSRLTEDGVGPASGGRPPKVWAWS